ncbi:hypothetical protein ID866_11887 [Astraeus odoratus]|nr:hypothetical protein ID866_11887 [Astraeus odoratus]
MSTHKSSTTMGALAKKTVDWTEVPDEELVTDLDDTDSAEEAEKRWKEEERCQKEAEAEQRRKDKERKQAAAAEARKWQCADSEAQASGSRANMSACIRCVRLGLTCVIPTRVKKHLACGSCVKAKERCRERKKQAKKAADEDEDDEIIILSGQNIKQQGGGETLEEVTDRWWGELIQAVSSHMDMANGHLERIASMAQSNGWKMRCHYMLMEGLEELRGPPKVLRSHRSHEEKEDAPGNEPENGAGAEDGAEEEAQKEDKGKGKEKAL